jgi:hypothetical protein
MSEREEVFFNRAEKAIEGLEKTKKWYKTAIFAFAVAFLTFVYYSGMTVNSMNNYEEKILGIECRLSQTASLKAFDLVNRKFNMQTEALTKLITDEDTKKIVAEFNEECKKIYDDIFMFGTMVSRGDTNPIQK